MQKVVYILVGGNPCKTAACSQLCVLTHTLDNNGRGYRCLCEAGFQIQQDGRNCIGKSVTEMYVDDSHLTI